MAKELLEGAAVQPIRVRFYIDGYHGYLLSQAVAAFHRTFWQRVKADFPPHDSCFEIFDFDPTPEKLADILVGLLRWSVEPIARSAEAMFERNGHEVIPKAEIDSLSNPFVRDIFGKRERLNASGKLFVSLEHDGVVFAPAYDDDRMIRDLDHWERELRTQKCLDENLLSRIAVERDKVQRGKYKDSERFYRALADKLGRLSQVGRRRLERNSTKTLFVEKSVDEDMNSTLWADHLDEPIDLFVLVTNDGDHAPHVAKLRARGQKLAMFTYDENPARALQEALGAQNILNLLECSRDFEFADVWLKKQDRRSFDILEDIMRQWEYWKRQGLVS